ncbi:hypothetical protein FNH05_01945 [Amycolatopsis rhizosphaerae]|uniref:Uncharacterized protein n=1 Tax=Amycolatopsis rhizosphaerae TaxID=2053003 RepID=A0A558DLK7_9PSEU|nr:hypothetical protein [Amycolatopsis rhizosphaerae]TVT61906.1 hypothetical protein FNH05_01945 [Amycolatopsis rhizosphaerae]
MTRRLAVANAEGSSELAQSGWLSDVNFWIKDDPSAPGSPAAGASGGAIGGTAGPSGGQGFSLTRDEAESMLRQVQGVLRDIDFMQTKANALTKVTPPAQDPASVTFNARLWATGKMPAHSGMASVIFNVNGRTSTSWYNA